MLFCLSIEKTLFTELYTILFLSVLELKRDLSSIVITRYVSHLWSTDVIGSSSKVCVFAVGTERADFFQFRKCYAA